MLNTLPLIVGIMLWGYVLTNITKIKECFGPILSIAVSMAVLEIGGAFGILWPTAYVYCIAVCIFSIVYIARTADKTAAKAYFSNPSIIGFLFASSFYMVLSSKSALFYTNLDSFLHWGLFSKAVFYNHNLDVWNSNLYVNHHVYPHGMASWYSLFALGKRDYTERDVMLSINTLLFASSCPIIDMAVCRIRKLLPEKKSTSLFIYLISGMSVASLLWIWQFGKIWAYKTGYMDIPLGAVFMASLCLAVTACAGCYRKAFGVSLLSAMLVMIKPSGIIFVSVVCLVYLANEYIGSESHITPYILWKLFRKAIVAVSVPLIELGIWNVMTKYLGVAGGDQFNLSAFFLSNVITRYQSDAAYAKLFPVVIRNFFTAFFTRRVSLHISAFCWMVLCIAIATLTIIFQKDPREKKKVLYVNICMLLLFCLYNLFLLWTYLTTMSEGEAVGVACYDRYIGSYIIGWFMLCIYLLLFYNGGDLKVQYLYLGIFFLCNIWGFLNKNNYIKEIQPEIREIYELGNEIRECIPENTYDASQDMPDLWISYGDKKEALYSDQIVQLRYYLFPDFDFTDIYEIQKSYNREIKDIIAEFSFDYVVLYGVNEEFYNSYYWFFTDGLSNAQERYKNGQYQAYKVIRDETTDEFCWFEPIKTDD